jgi:dTMP kinase
MKINKGRFITFEGIDASGKTTNVPILADHLRERGYKVITTREPGGGAIGPQIRDILLHGEKIDDVTELLLFLADRNEHVKKLIQPHLDAGYIVISDRFYDSTWAYQGMARGMISHLEALGEYVSAGLIPDYTLFFNLPFEESVRRLALRKGQQDRLDTEEESFRRKVYDGYQTRLGAIVVADEKLIISDGRARHVRNVHQINALPEPETVTQSVKAWANTVFENLN